MFVLPLRPRLRPDRHQGIHHRVVGDILAQNRPHSNFIFLHNVKQMSIGFNGTVATSKDVMRVIENVPGQASLLARVGLRRC